MPEGTASCHLVRPDMSLWHIIPRSIQLSHVSSISNVSELMFVLFDTSQVLRTVLIENSETRTVHTRKIMVFERKQLV